MDAASDANSPTHDGGHDANGRDALAKDGSEVEDAPSIDAGSTVTCTYTTQFACTPSATCVAPAPVNVVADNVPLYIVSGCNGFYPTGFFTPSQYSIVVDAPQVFGDWVEPADSFCLGTETEYPDELVAQPIEALGGHGASFMAFITLAGTAATVSISGSQSVFVAGCESQDLGFCEYQELSCSGAGTALISPCDTNRGGCDPAATCAWTGPTSNSCTCDTGYTGDGQTCTPVPNPCLTNNGGCNVNASCIDSLGAPLCECNAGYTGNGIQCVPVP